ncbi:MAG: hypothetical protein GXC94_06350 [Comamonadaceae bacterium]|jgi:type II secretory pathway pseudopilin PulG|nr:hypothetical protein [Comamonadaceae bacterium]
MKVLVLAAVLAALSTPALAGATRDANAQTAVNKTTTAAVIADASRLGSTGLTSLNGSPWAPQSQPAETGFGDATPEIDTGTLLTILGVLVAALARPIGRALRRQEQQRRAAALASTLSHPPRG